MPFCNQPGGGGTPKPRGRDGQGAAEAMSTAQTNGSFTNSWPENTQHKESRPMVLPQKEFCFHAMHAIFICVRKGKLSGCRKCVCYIVWWCSTFPKTSCLSLCIRRLAVPLHEKAPVAQQGSCDQWHTWLSVPKLCQEILRTPASCQTVQ